MRTLRRNKQKIYYADYLGRETIVDEYGNETGEYRKVYNAPIELMANVSPAQGKYSTRQFGDIENYNKVIVLEKSPISETSILWIDNLDIAKPHDYVVERIAQSLNSVSIAVRKVTVSE